VKKAFSWITALTATFFSIGVVPAVADQKPAFRPSKQVTIIVPYSPGGGTDTVARLLAKALDAKWGQTVIVDNRISDGCQLHLGKTTSNTSRSRQSAKLVSLQIQADRKHERRCAREYTKWIPARAAISLIQKR